MSRLMGKAPHFSPQAFNTLFSCFEASLWSPSLLAIGYFDSSARLGYGTSSTSILIFLPICFSWVLLRSWGLFSCLQFIQQLFTCEPRPHRVPQPSPPHPPRLTSLPRSRLSELQETRSAQHPALDAFWGALRRHIADHKSQPEYERPATCPPVTWIWFSFFDHDGDNIPGRRHWLVLVLV